jgi:hypothetical protein
MLIQRLQIFSCDASLKARQIITALRPVTRSARDDEIVEVALATVTLWPQVIEGKLCIPRLNQFVTMEASTAKPSMSLSERPFRTEFCLAFANFVQRCAIGVELGELDPSVRLSLNKRMGGYEALQRDHDPTSSALNLIFP